MTKGELYSLMMKCSSSQLTALSGLLELNPAFLSDPGQPTANRAAEILNLAVQRQLLPKLEQILLEFSGSAAKSKRILFLSANPIEADKLETSEELKLIKQRLNESEPGRKYQVEWARAVRSTELSRLLMEHEPVIVHFGGHGSATGDIVLEDESGRGKPLAVNLLAHLFEVLKISPECVVLNACYSVEKAKALANHVGCVIGMEKTIGDPSALQFAAGFYRGLAFGKDYRQAFELGCVEVDLANLPDSSVPHFTIRDEDDIGQIILEKGKPAVTLAVAQRTWVPPGAAAVEPDRLDSPRLYPVWFGTDRRPNDPNDLTQGFASEREQDEVAVHLGICKVSIPKSHRFGSVGSVWWKRYLTLTDDRLRVAEIATLSSDSFWASAREALMTVELGQRVALVFIHGFRVTFEEAAIRAAQMGFDLKIPGITAFYSWPSKGRLGLTDYAADEATIEASAPKITNFLVQFSEKTAAERIHVIAHSMGNRGLLNAMQRIVGAAAAAAKKPFHHIIFAAPDVDAAVFRDLAKAHDALADHATLYVSSLDRAVKSSGLLHAAPRAGFVPPVTTVAGIDTIEVSNVDLTLLGHGYYAAAEGVLYDIHEMITHDAPPAKRSRLTDTNLGYWQISK